VMTERLTTRTAPIVLPEQGQRTSRPQSVALHYEAVERSIMAMRERLDEPLSLDAMAAVAILSRYHFLRVFHRVTGLSPARFLAALRLAEAKRLLLTTPLSVTDICFKVGYNSPGSFTTRFTQSVGMSPSRFRQLLRPDSLHNALRDPGDGSAVLQDTSRTGRITGRIHASAPAPGPVFVGLFQTAVPEGQPTRCGVLPGSGAYLIEQVPKGMYYLLAASFPWPDNPLAALLPGGDALHIGSYQGPIYISSGQTLDNVHITLRPAIVTDPPILVVLPQLLDRGTGEHDLEERAISEKL
jgi:AraC family transcriptional regulator